MRVNARFDEPALAQLEYLTQSTGESVSEVLRQSVAAYYTQVRAQRQPSRFLALAGTGDSGRSDISSNIRAYLGESLERKHGLAPLPPPGPAARKGARKVARKKAAAK